MKIEDLFIGAVVVYKGRLCRVTALISEGALPYGFEKNTASVLFPDDVEAIVHVKDLKGAIINHESLLAIGAQVFSNCYKFGEITVTQEQDGFYISGALKWFLEPHQGFRVHHVQKMIELAKMKAQKKYGD